MSRLFNYCAPNMARIYDKMRLPMGVDVIAGWLYVYCRKPLQDIRVLDAGCGTGHYAKPLLDLGVGKITLLDASQEMLTVAQENLAIEIQDKKIDKIVKAVLPDIPFEEETFDAVMFNNSLLHLTQTGDGPQYPVLQQGLQNTHRVLRKDGVLIVSTILQETIHDSVWIGQLHSGLLKMFDKKLMPIQEYLDQFSKCRFECISAVNVSTATGQNLIKNYWDAGGPLSIEWRQASNIYNKASDEEIREMEENLQEKMRNGTIEKFIKEHDCTREKGLATLFVCTKK